MGEKQMEEWDLWYPKAAATGIPFGRSKIDPVDTVIVHSAPEVLTVRVRDRSGALKAEGTDLQRTNDSPMTRLRCIGGKIEREDVWLTVEDLGQIVLLPGGEAGVLQSWWHAEDRSEWRWTVEFYNHS